MNAPSCVQCANEWLATLPVGIAGHAWPLTKPTRPETDPTGPQAEVIVCKRALVAAIAVLGLSVTQEGFIGGSKPEGLVVRDDDLGKVVGRVSKDVGVAHLAGDPVAHLLDGEAEALLGLARVVVDGDIVQV
jgi:hypothetical protein